MKKVYPPNKQIIDSVLDTKSDYKLAMDVMLEKLVLKNYSQNTIKTYKHMFKLFLEYINPMPLHQVSTAHIMHYHKELVIKRKVSASYQNQSINALKFYMEKVLNLPRMSYDFCRPRKSKTLPKVLSLEEVSRILNQTNNIKHRTILSVIYGCGLIPLLP